MSVTVKLTKIQAQEVRHKMQILAEEPELQESYEISEDEAADLAATFENNEQGQYTFAAKFAEVIASELENSLDIASANHRHGGSASDLAYIKSLKSAVQKIRGAA